jgi:hypothetical protein
MIPKSRIDGIRLKVKRAKKHIADLESAIRSFLDEKPYTLATKPHPIAEIHHTTLYVSDVKPVPDDISLIIGDAVHNLRASLDYLMWQLVEAGGGVPNRNIYFPISDTPQQYQSAIGNGEIQKIVPDALDIIGSVQPYKTADQTLWLLHQLDIIDKHRLLLTVTASMDKWGVDLAKGINMWFNEDRFIPLIAGYEVVNIPTSTYNKPDQDFQLGVDIAFGESEIPEGELVLYTLNKLADFVDALVGQLNRFLI